MVTKLGLKAVLLICISFAALHPAWAGLSWKTLTELRLEGEPLDVAASEDGQSVFVLLSGEILVYSVQRNQVEKKIPIDQPFDRITYSPKLNALVLTGTRSKALKILKLQDIHEIDVSGLPFKGPENAPVTVAVFSDYQ